MSDFLQFHPLFPTMWLLPVLLLLTFLLVWQEGRKSYRFRWLRMTSQILAIAALTGLALRPGYTAKEPRPALILLTPNYAPALLDSMKKTSGNIRVVSAPGVDGVDKIASYRELKSMGDLQFVLGDGVPPGSLAAVRSDPFVFFSSEKPDGIVSLNVGPFAENRAQRISGEIRNASGSRLTLIGPGGVEDSLRIKKGGLQPFALKFTTKGSGRFVYTLSMTDSSGRRVDEAVPVDVRGSRKLRILMLQTYPQAEIRFLKNYLADKGHAITTRYTLSKGIFRYEFANTIDARFNSLTTQILETFDLVLTDQETLNRLTGSDVREISSGVDKGLGLLLVLQGKPDRKKFPGDVLDLVEDEKAADTIRYDVVPYGSFVSPFTALRPGSNRALQAVMRSGKQILCGFVLQGEGKVAFQSLRETYRLTLEGETGSYAALWTPLLEQTARREDISLTARVTTPFPIYPDEPVDLELIGSGPVSVKNADGSRVPLTEDVLVDDVWHGTFWAGTPGWTELTVGDQMTVNAFVSSPGAWRSLNQANRQRANQLAAATDLKNDATWQVEKPVNPLWFFAAFLLSAGFVWLAPKL